MAIAQPGQAAGTEIVRREASVDFAIDPAFQADGGVQVFFELIQADDRPSERPTVTLFRTALDSEGRWARVDEPLHVAVARISYVIEKDVSFFSRERTFDLSYVRAIAPDMRISGLPDGGFAVGKMPSNQFGLSYREEPFGLEAATALAGHGGSPVVIQHNEGFARVAGWRTAAFATTATFHQPLGPGRTRLTVLTLNALYNLPPFFLGGRDRLYADLLEQTVLLIGRLRGFQVDTSVTRLEPAAIAGEPRVR